MPVRRPLAELNRGAINCVLGALPNSAKRTEAPRHSNFFIDRRACAYYVCVSGGVPYATIRIFVRRRPYDGIIACEWFGERLTYRWLKRIAGSRRFLSHARCRYGKFERGS